MAADRAPGRRLAYLDNLKWVLVAAIIATHAGAAYGAAGAWFYVEPSLSPIARTLVSAPSDVGMLFGLGTFMLVAGLLTPQAVVRKGLGKFVGDRLMRLGLPLIAAVVVVVPAVYWLIVQVTGYPATFPDILRYQAQHLEPGPMWFVAVLLLFTLCYAAWRWVRPAGKGDARRSLEMRHLLIAAMLIAALNFLVWLVFPLASVQPLELKVWEWPELAVLFAFGVLAGERGWLAQPPSALIRRSCWLAPLPAVAVVAWVLVAYGSSQPPYVSFTGGWRWQAAVLALAWGVVAVGFSLAMIDLFRQIGNRSGPLLRALGRDSYAAFFLQTPVLVALELCLRRFTWPGELKLAVVAPAGIAISFALAWAVRSAFADLHGRRRASHPTTSAAGAPRTRRAWRPRSG